MQQIESAFGDLREEANVLRHNGHVAQARTLDRAIDLIQDALAPLGVLRWVSEREATARSGRAGSYFRVRFDRWAEDGLAEMRGRHRFYRECVVERQPMLSVERERARQDGAALRRTG
jgi:hypothetical protein